MGVYRKPLKRSILIAVILFISMLCLVLSVTQYFTYRDTCYARYQEYIGNILRFTASGLDADELAACMKTGEKTEKFEEMQSFLDQVRANVSLHYLYVVVPLNDGETDNMMNVIAAVSEYEYEFMADELVQLNQLTGRAYSSATARKYLNAYNSGELSFFEEASQWGVDYTGLLPLRDSAGNKVAALCMDVDIQEIRDALVSQTVNTIVLIVLMGVLFAVTFFFWADANITRPIREMEASVVDFAKTSHQQRDPDALLLRMPEIHTGNEVESLARAVVKMSEDMRDYVISNVVAERELAKLNVLAHKDGLTHVGNKTAYEQYTKDLNIQLKMGPVEFAILMLDLNYLKTINDHYGHDKGDSFLKKCCNILCDVFTHSPVFRIGGDEFVVMLTGQDYQNRKALIQSARLIYGQTCAQQNAQPWEQISVAMGVAKYNPYFDHSVEDVFGRADKNMYQEKERMKCGR